jgi:hypothetical protein
LIGLLDSSRTEEIGRGLLTCCGILWNQQMHTPTSNLLVADKLPLNKIEEHLFCEEPAILEAAIWAWTYVGRMRHGERIPPPPTPLVLDRMLSIWLNGPSSNIAEYALSTQGGLPRDA